MTLTNYAHDSGVLINKCRSCSGVWLADGQLELLAQFREAASGWAALGDALAAEIRSENRLQDLVHILRSRTISGGVAGIYLLFPALAGDFESAFQLARFLALPLFSIWFCDGIGNRLGERTPGTFIAVGGWVLLMSPAIASATVLLLR